MLVRHWSIIWTNDGYLSSFNTVRAAFNIGNQQMVGIFCEHVKYNRFPACPLSLPPWSSARDPFMFSMLLTLTCFWTNIPMDCEMKRIDAHLTSRAWSLKIKTVHISVTQCCIVGYGTVALLDLCSMETNASVNYVVFISGHDLSSVRHSPLVKQVIANPRWRGKRSRHSRCMRNQQIYESGKRPITLSARVLTQCFITNNRRQRCSWPNLKSNSCDGRNF